MYHLVITDEEHQEIVVPFIRDEISIGRKDGNTIRLTERNISRFHAVLTKIGEDYFVEDLDSYNGVYLNGNQITRKTALYSEDLLEIGDYRIQLKDIDRKPLPKVELTPQDVEKTEEPKLDLDSQVFDNTNEKDIEAPVDKSKKTLEQAQQIVANLPATDLEVHSEDPKKTQQIPNKNKQISRQPNPNVVTQKMPIYTKEEMVESQLKEPEPIKSEPEPEAITQKIPTIKKEESEPPVQESAIQEEPEENIEETIASEPEPEIQEPPVQEPEVQESAVQEPEPEAIAEEETPVEQTTHEEVEDGFGTAVIDNAYPEVEEKGFGKIIAIIVVAIAIIGTGAFFALSGNKDEPEEIAEPELVMPKEKVVEEIPKEIVAVKQADKKAKDAIEKSLQQRKVKLAHEVELAAEKEKALKNKLIASFMKEAKEKFRNQRWVEAEEAVKSLLQSVPDYQPAIELRIKIRKEKENKGNFQNGLKALSANNHFQALSLFGSIDELSFYGSEAKANYRIVQKRMVTEATTKGWKEYRKAKYSLALSYAEKALEYDPKAKDALQLKKAAKLKSKEKASKSQNKKPRKPKLSAKQHYNIAIANYRNKKIDLAIKHFRSAIKQDRKFANAYRGLGTCYALKRQLKPAMSAYQKYLKLNPNAPDAKQVRQIIEDYKKRQ